jgi:hemerythrin
METFAWQDKFSVHVDEIDRQHKRLLEYFTDIQKELMSDNTSQKIANLLDAVAEYFDFHFAEEERLMKSMNYPELDMQINLHAIYLNELNEVIRQFNLGAIPGSRVVALFRDWYVNHMLFEDHKYGKMIERGKPLV